MVVLYGVFALIKTKPDKIYKNSLGMRCKMLKSDRDERHVSIEQQLSVAEILARLQSIVKFKSIQNR